MVGHRDRCVAYPPIRRAVVTCLTSTRRRTTCWRSIFASAHDLARDGGVTDPEVLLAILLHDAEEPLGTWRPRRSGKALAILSGMVQGVFAPILEAIAMKAGINPTLL